MPKKQALPDIIPEVKFNLKAQEQFAKDRGIVLEHWSAMPSPIGLKDRGEYRRSDSLDTIAENGFIYKKIGEFTGTIIGNGKGHDTKVAEGGLFDDSVARLVIPKYYNCNKKAISMLPGDRIYAKNIELKVANYQRAEYNPKSSDYLQFPAVCVEFLTDSNGKEYKQGTHFKVNKNGNISWINGKQNPGIDPETGKGRVYSVRYTYLAFWYVQRLVNEIRITNTNTSKEPSRLPYHVTIQREYVYHNKNRGDVKDVKTTKTHTERTNEQPKEKLDSGNSQIKVNIKNFE